MEENGKNFKKIIFYEKEFYFYCYTTKHNLQALFCTIFTSLFASILGRNIRGKCATAKLLVSLLYKDFCFHGW